MAPCFIYYQHCIYTNKWSTDFKKHAMFCYSYRLEMHTYYITGCTDNNIIVCVVFMRWNPRVNFVKSSNLFSSTVIFIFYTLCHISIIIYVHLYYLRNTIFEHYYFISSTLDIKPYFPQSLHCYLCLITFTTFHPKYKIFNYYQLLHVYLRLFTTVPPILKPSMASSSLIIISVYNGNK